ncbi:MAG: FAD-dependent oxidoreductase [Spirochaetota bacterium]|nr:FAD-dependent oxidoreductase [Spirochaetota bacterium]
MKIIMVGGGGASIVCANTLRLLRNHAQIDIYTRRERTAYTPCEQPFFLRNVLTFDEMFYANLEWFASKKIGLYTQRNVETIDRERKIIMVDGEEISYDILLINTGAKSKMPPVPGFKGERVLSLISDLKSAKQIESILPIGKSAVIIGGGVVGLEMAETLIKKSYSQVSIIVSSENILSQQLDPDMAKWLEPDIINAGVSLYLSTSIKKAILTDENVKIFLSGDKLIEADWAFISKGIVPDTDLAMNAGLKIGKTGGIEVNKYLQTSDPSIYAAGDCVEGWHMLSGKKFINGLATNSNRNGRVIARNIHFGNVVPFAGALHTFGAEIFGKTVVSVGLTERKSSEEGLDAISVKRTSKTRKKMFNGEDIRIKLFADPEKQTLIGAQLIGPREVSRIGERIILMVGEEIPLAKISQYETIFSPPLSNAYDIITNGIDILISNIIEMGKEIKWE